jgi:secreted trypsin-like serine protease
MRCFRLATMFALAAASASAMVGGAPPAGDFARAAIMIVGSRGNSCTGTLIARDLVLTAAHCVPPGFDYKLVQFDAQKQPNLRDTLRIERHPQFSRQSFDNHRATADVALIKLASPAQNAAQATLFSGTFAVAPGDRFSVAGYGLSELGNGKTGGTLRAANLVATGKPGNLQIRLVDPAANGERTGLGACTGDSGAPVFQDHGGRFLLIGVVSWTTGPNNTEGCGGLTGVTPLSLYRGWIVETARKLGSPLAP